MKQTNEGQGAGAAGGRYDRGRPQAAYVDKGKRQSPPQNSFTLLWPMALNNAGARVSMLL